MLFVNELAGFGDSPQLTTATFLSSSTDTVDRTNYTFTINLGPDDPLRYIVVAAHGVHNAAATLNGVSIAGVSGTQIKNIVAGTTRIAALYAAIVPSGATGDIVLNFSTSIGRAGYGAWSLLSSGGDATSPYSSGGTTALSGGDLTLNLATPSNGVAIAAVLQFATAGPVASSWSGVSEDYDTSYSEASTQGQSGAHVATSGSTLTITDTITNASAGNVALVAASFK